MTRDERGEKGKPDEPRNGNGLAWQRVSVHLPADYSTPVEKGNTPSTQGPGERKAKSIELELRTVLF